MKKLIELRDQYAAPCDEATLYDSFKSVTYGKGMYVWFEGDKSPYLDLVMGFSSVNFGHGHPDIIDIVKTAAESLAHVHSFNSRNKLELSEFLNQQFQTELQTDETYKIHFNVGGSNAVDSSILMARKATEKTGIVSFKGAYHGCNYGAAWVSDSSYLNKEQYGPLPGDQIQITYPEKGNPRLVDRALTEFENVLIRDHDIAAIIMEPALGAGGIILPDESFFPEFKRLLDLYNVLFIDDEIQVGVGRTGPFYSISHYGLVPDIILLGKSLAAGFAAISAVMAKGGLFDLMEKKGTAFQGTFANHIFGTDVAYHTMKWAARKGLFGKETTQVQQYLIDEIIELEHKFSFIKSSRGLGMAFAFDIVNADTGAPDAELAARLKSIALNNNIIIYCCGQMKNIIKLLPPLTISMEDAKIIVNELNRILSMIS